VSLNAVSIDPDVISKAEFARRRGVSPGRVSQWLSEEKITGAAIVGEGRNAQIRETVAVEQLRKRLDPMQMTGNGLSTDLRRPAAAEILQFTLPSAASGPPPPAAPPAGDTVEDEIKRLRRDQLARQEREGKRQEAVNAGRLTDAAAAKAEAARATSRLITMFEGALSDFATAISAEFKLSQRDVLHLLRAKFRDVRTGAASELREAAAALPAVIAVDLDGTDQEEPEDA
jgi:hypothetical protein